MKAFKTERGFIRVNHERYASEPTEEAVLIAESSAIGGYDDSMELPGSSYLWIGEAHHLDREGVADMIRRMQHWLDHKRLPLD